MNWKHIGKRLLFPHPILLTLLTLLAAAGMVYSGLKLDSNHPLSIAAYALSFCALMLLCLRVPQMVCFVRRCCEGSPFCMRYASDVQFRMRITLTFSFGWNGVYALFQLILGLAYRSAWFYAMAGYYLLLTLLRLRLLRQLQMSAPGSSPRTEWRIYRLCGIGLLLMNLSLLIFLLCFVFRLREVHHHEIVTIAMAAYTFFTVVLAACGVLRYRRYESPVLSAAKAVSLASALVSLLALENTMLSTFHEETEPLFRRLMLVCSGAGISLCILSMAGYMIWHGTKAARKCKVELMNDE